MDSQSGFYSLLRQNLLPVLLVTAGIAFLLIGIFVVLTKSQNNSSFQFKDDVSQAPASNQPSLVVDIEGGVINPGIYKLPSDSRIHDLLVAAGGLSGSADRAWVQKNINQAAKLTDGQKIYILRSGEDIGTSASAQSGADSSSTTALVNINSASLTDLDSLPGIGPITAQKIVDGRPYSSTQDLLSKKVVSSSVFDKIKDKISAQ